MSGSNDPIDPTNPNGYPEPADPRFKGWLDPEDPQTKAKLAHYDEHAEAFGEALRDLGWSDPNAILQAVHQRLQARGVAPIQVAPGVVAYNQEALLAGLSELVASGARGDGR